MDHAIVIKCGGSTVDQLTKEFYEGIGFLQQSGLKPVIVHGGGPAIEKVLNALGTQTEFVDGLRKTSAEVLEAVEMALSGIVSNSIVRSLGKCGLLAAGLNGCDGRLICAEALDLARLGLVGDIKEVNTGLLLSMLDMGVVPVISPIAFGLDEHDCYNVNADTAAGAVAEALGAERMVIITDVPGVLDKRGKVMASATESELLCYMNEGVITGGMIPKVKAALGSLQGGVKEVVITNGRSGWAGTEGLSGTAILKTMEAIR